MQKGPLLIARFHHLFYPYENIMNSSNIVILEKNTKIKQEVIEAKIESISEQEFFDNYISKILVPLVSLPRLIGFCIILIGELPFRLIRKIIWWQVRITNKTI